MNTFNEKIQGDSGTGSGKRQIPRGFWGNLGLIRPAAWVVAVALLIGMQFLFWYVAWPQSHPDEMARMPFALKVFLPILAGMTCFIYVLLVGFIYVDAKRRGMRQVMWTLLAIFIPNAIGIILYFVMRDPLPVTCASCHTSVLSKFTFCPSCGAPMRPTCPQCGKAVEMGWSHCAD